MLGERLTNPPRHLRTLRLHQRPRRLDRKLQAVRESAAADPRLDDLQRGDNVDGVQPAGKTGDTADAGDGQYAVAGGVPGVCGDEGSGGSGGFG